jgi:hypothetical protein
MTSATDRRASRIRASIRQTRRAAVAHPKNYTFKNVLAFRAWPLRDLLQRHAAASGSAFANYLPKTWAIAR